jgi:hypothetical protein
MFIVVKMRKLAVMHELLKTYRPTVTLELSKTHKPTVMHELLKMYKPTVKQPKTSCKTVCDLLFYYISYEK